MGNYQSTNYSGYKTTTSGFGESSRREENVSPSSINTEYESTQTKDKTKKRLFLGRWTWKEYVVLAAGVAALLALAGLLTVVILNLAPLLALGSTFFAL